MWIYVLVLILLSLVGTYELGSSKKYRSVIHCIIFGILFIFGGLRYEVGTDWFGYYNIFDRTLGGQDATIEFGFIKLISVFSSFTSQYELFSILIFLFGFGLKFIAMRRLGIFLGLSAVLYFATIFVSSDINQIRQGLSMGICMYAIVFIRDRSLWRFVLCVLLATTFHYTAIVFMPAFWIGNMKLNRKFLIVATCVLLANYFISHIYLLNILSLDRLALLGEGMVDKFSSYLEGDEGFETAITIIIRLATFGFLLFFADKMRLEERNKRIFINLYFFSLVVYFFVSGQPMIAGRLGSYYKMTEVLFMPGFIIIFTSWRLRLLGYIVIVLYAYLSLYRTFQIPDNGLVPYKNMLLEWI